MKQFFKIFFASLLAMIVMGFIFFGFIIAGIIGQYTGHRPCQNHT